jgi:hypothetical protein
MWPFKKRKTIEQQYEDAILDVLKEDPKRMVWVFSMCDKDKKIFATMIHLASVTDEMARNPDRIDAEQSDARASLYANEEDSYLASIEAVAEDKTLRDLITHRRNELWAENGLIGKMAKKYKEKSDQRRKT